MSGIVTLLFILLIMVFMFSNGSKRFLRLVYMPYGPKMCDERRRDLNHSFMYTRENLACRHGNSSWNDELAGTGNEMMLSTRNSSSTAVQSTKDNCTAGEAEYIPHDQKTARSLLFQACKTGDLCSVKYILDKGLVNINCKSPEFGTTPVMLAAVKGKLAVFDFLVSYGCDLTAVDRNGNNVLHLATIGGVVDIVRKLTSRNAYDLNHKGVNGLTPLMLAVTFGRRDVFDFLLNAGSSISILDKNNNNVLHMACIRGHVDFAEYFLSLNIFDIESRGQFNCTPAMIAASEGHIAVLKLLVIKGCNLKAVDKEGHNVLHLACISDQVDMVKYIINNKLASKEDREIRGCTPVMIAAAMGVKETFDFLVKQHCVLTKVDNGLDTILHKACSGGNVDIVKYIISQHVVDIDSRGLYGYTPVMKAVEKAKIKVVKVLVQSGCDFTIVDSLGNTVLHIASLIGDVDTLKYFLSLGFLNGTEKNKLGRTPQQIALTHGHSEVVPLFKH